MLGGLPTFFARSHLRAQFRVRLTPFCPQVTELFHRSAIVAQLKASASCVFVCVRVGFVWASWRPASCGLSGSRGFVVGFVVVGFVVVGFVVVHGLRCGGFRRGGLRRGGLRCGGLRCGVWASLWWALLWWALLLWAAAVWCGGLPVLRVMGCYCFV